MDYLKIPLDLSASLHHKLERCSSEESIAQQIMLLITSRYGELVGKSGYGSAIADLEFEQLVKASDWEDKVRDSLIKAIYSYEKRLKDVQVKVVLSEVTDDYGPDLTSIRRQAQIIVFGKIIVSNLPFHFSTLVYISPLSQ